MKIAYKTKTTNSRRTSRGPAPCRGPAVEKHCLRGTENIYPSFFQLFEKYFEKKLASCVLEKVHLFRKRYIKLIIHEFVFSDFSGDEFLYKPWSQLYFPCKRLMIFNTVSSVSSKQTFRFGITF